MRYLLLRVFIIVLFTSQAQSVYFYKQDSTPIKNVLVANITMDESVFSDKEGRVDLTIFQDKEELLQIIHQSFQTVVLPKYVFVEQGNIYLEKLVNIIDQVKVTVLSKTKETTYELITQTKSISKENIQQQAPVNSADMLANTGQVLIQKSQLGGGSPIIRGFEANRILLVVDGVRMNNAIYRGGHLQNAISIDPNMLEGTEVIFGPNSLIYGSDALGGVIHFKTRDPKLKTVDSIKVDEITGAIRYQSALDAKVAHLSYNTGSKRLGYIVGITQSKFNDLTMGKTRLHGFDEFGKIKHFITQSGGKDSMVVNTDENTVVGSGYSQTDLLWKGLYQPTLNLKYKLNFQHSTSSDVPRVDKLNEYRDGVLRYGEWYYGPQNRTLMSFSTEIDKKTKLFDYNNNILAYQFIEEDRISRQYQSSIKEFNEEDVSVYSLNSDFIKYLDSTQSLKLNYGIELLHNQVNSEAYTQNITTKERGFLSTRYPGMGSKFFSGAIYLALQKKVKRHLFKGGLRYSTSSILSDFESNEIIDLIGIQKKSLINQALTSSAGYVYHKANYKFYSSISSAFKAPNVDDFSKIFEKKGVLTIPNPNLKPETSINGEVGSNYMNRYFDIDVAFFYTQVVDLMTKLPTNIDGVSTVDLNGDNVNLVSVQNDGVANVYGGFIALRLKLSNTLNWHSTATVTKAHFKGENENVPHIPPFYGKTSLNYKLKRLKFSVYTRFNGKKDWRDFNVLNDNPDEAVYGYGSPAWAILNISAFMYLYKALKIQVAAENLLDAHYKTFASGISSPGRNLMASVYFNF